jgi:peptide deformylase
MAGRISWWSLVVLTALVAGSCATVRAPVATTVPTVAVARVPSWELTSIERYQILRGTAEEPLDLVLNDLAAGDRFLRSDTTLVEPGDPAVAHLADRMLATVQDVGGVGIAAPQVGLGRRMFLAQRLDQEGEPFQAFLNPHFLEMDPLTEVGWEGCLSIPAGFGEVERPVSVLVEYDTLDGAREIERVEGFTAVILQHEMDHLDGVLFIDRMVSRELMPEQEYRAMRAEEVDVEGAGE